MASHFLLSLIFLVLEQRQRLISYAWWRARSAIWATTWSFANRPRLEPAKCAIRDGGAATLLSEIPGLFPGIAVRTYYYPLDLEEILAGAGCCRGP